ncbi:MAG: alpha-1,2-fucosyltransferase [Spirochaetia bacterium]|nr:alpha-1,2-fucosyltransferase [Spirochaetia bacterium]
MIIFFQSGRLGNQIFQYLFLKNKLQKNKEKIILIGFKELSKLLFIKDIFILPLKRDSYLFLILRRIARIFVKHKIVSTTKIIKKEYSGYLTETAETKYIRGFFTNINLVQQGYFQDGSLWTKKDMNDMKIKENHLSRAFDILKSVPVKMTPVFIHVRRGDYLSWGPYNKSAALPIEYYINSIKKFDLKKTFFIVLSDDKEYVQNKFQFIKNKKILCEDQYLDFSVMTLCSGGILSASSFSYWGAMLMLKNKPKAPIYAPNYWAGFQSKIWFPYKIKNKLFHYISV